MKKNFLLFMVFILAAVIVSCGNDSKKSSTSKAPGNPAPAGNPAVATVSFQAYDINGTLRNASEWIGKQPVVVNIWGTWCPPCRREIPDLVKLYKEYQPKGVEIIGLAVEKGPPEFVSKFSEKMGMNWVMLIGDQSHLELYQTTSVPTTIFYDRSGKEVQRMVGMRNYEQFKPAFEAIAKN